MITMQNNIIDCQSMKTHVTGNPGTRHMSFKQKCTFKSNNYCK